LRRRRKLHLGQFAEKNHVSVDWLLCGDLKGRLRMARGWAPPAPKLNEDGWREFVGLVGQIEPQRLSHVLEYMRLLAAEAKLTS